jgi:aminoglycoside phosphotransferase (APT) family kinase protein
LAAVKRDLVPDLSSDMAKNRAEMIEFVLSRLIAEHSVPAALRGEYWNGVKTALTAAEPAKPDLAQVVATIAQTQEPPPPAPAGVPERALSDAVQALLQAPRQGEACNAMPAVDRMIHGIAQAEVGYRDRFEAMVAEAARPPASKTAPANSPINDASLTAYLRRRFPERPGIRAARVTPIPGGRSKGTTLFTLESEDAPPRDLVIRQDFPQVAGLPVGYEFPLIQTVWKAGLAVPEPVWYEGEETDLGGPFVVFAKVPGKPGGTLFRMGSPAGVARDAAKFFAQLHSVDIDATHLRDKLLWSDAPHPVKAMLDFYYAKWKAAETAPSPLIETAFLWLYSHLSLLDPVARLVHGDSSYHNMLIHDGRLSAVLDWEFAHAGDPAEDLLGSEHYTTEVLPWQEFIDIYLAHGGKPISKGRFQFFALWRSLRWAIATAVAGHVYTTGRDRDLRLATIGYTSHPRLLQDVARQLAAID